MILSMEIAWAAGFIEGEGYMGYQPGGSIIVTAAQTFLEPLEQLQRLFGGKIHAVKPKPNRKQAWTWACHGKHGAAAIMCMLPLLSQRRQAQAFKSLTAWRSVSMVKVACRFGHPFSADNTRWYGKVRRYRRCLVCMREYDRQWHQRKRDYNKMYHASRAQPKE